jgi:hypothetical protein
MFSTPPRSDIERMFRREEVMGIYSLDHARAPDTEDSHAYGMNPLGRTILEKLMAESTTVLVHNSISKGKRPLAPTPQPISHIRNKEDAMRFLFGEPSDDEDASDDEDSARQHKKARTDQDDGDVEILSPPEQQRVEVDLTVDSPLRVDPMLVEVVPEVLLLEDLPVNEGPRRWFEAFDLHGLFLIPPGHSISPSGLVFLQRWTCIQLGELDHFLTTDIELRALIRPTYEAYCGSLFPPPLRGTSALRIVYSQYRSLFAPCNPDDEERISDFMSWFSRPKAALPFLRLYSTYYNEPLQSLLWEFLSDPITFFCSFKCCLDELPDPIIWEWKLLLVEYRQRPHYQYRYGARPLSPQLSRVDYPFLALLDGSLHFQLLWKIQQSPQDPITMDLLPAILRSRTCPSSCLDPILNDLCQLQIHYRIIPRLTHMSQFRYFYPGSDFLEIELFRGLPDDMRSHLLNLQAAERV